MQVLDLRNNNLYGEIDKWSHLMGLSVLLLANNSFTGCVDFYQLSGQSSNDKSGLMEIDLSYNNFDKQTIEWSAFEHLVDLESVDISFNQFEGPIDVSYFEYCPNLKYFNVEYNLFSKIDNFDESIGETYMTNIEEFIINNNEIVEDFDVSYFKDSRNLKIIKCNNNSLTNSHLDMSDIPQSLVVFKCGNNDFGEFIWDSSPYVDYNLEHIDLSNSRIYGQITMKFFDNENGGYGELRKVDLGWNDNLNISIEFEYLDAQVNLFYLNFLGTKAYGFVDFEYLSDSTNITIKLDSEIYCPNSFCRDEAGGKIYGYTRNSKICSGRDECLDTCTCETAYTLGYEAYVDNKTADFLLNVLIGVVIGLTVLFIGGKIHSAGVHVVGYKSDYFELGGCLGFVFQIWDFFSDLLLCYDMYDHYIQESENSPDKNVYRMYLLLCASFIVIPWSINLIFLLQTKYRWQKAHKLLKNDAYGKGKGKKKKVKKNLESALSKSSTTTFKWLNKYSKVLVFLCTLINC